MNGSHSGNGTVKSEARKLSLKTYRDKSRREANRDRRMARVIKRLRGRHEIKPSATNPAVLEIRRAA